MGCGGRLGASRGTLGECAPHPIAKLQVAYVTSRPLDERMKLTGYDRSYVCSLKSADLARRRPDPGQKEPTAQARLTEHRRRASEGWRLNIDRDNDPAVEPHARVCAHARPLVAAGRRFSFVNFFFMMMMMMMLLLLLVCERGITKFRGLALLSFGCAPSVAESRARLTDASREFGRVPDRACEICCCCCCCCQLCVT